jgi:alkylated DNA repair dioxygenase AlkB
MRLESQVAPSCVDYRPGWVGDQQSLFDRLRDDINWEQHEITLFGRTVPVPRLTAWLGEAAYRYSGIVNQPIPWPSALVGLRDRLERETGVGFNSMPGQPLSRRIGLDGLPQRRRA